MFIDQKTMEQKHEIDLIDAHSPNSYVAVWHRPLCAWCLSEQGIAAGEGSHGICTMHAGGLLKQWRERGSRRRHQHF
jgi:hypothetical protein